MRGLIRPILVIVALVGVLIGARVYLVIDALGHGPYSAWYNSRCQWLADRGGLIGKPEGDIARILGMPSSVWDYDDKTGNRKTYNYDPAGIETAMFQVHCREDVVVGLEQFDD